MAQAASAGSGCGLAHCDNFEQQHNGTVLPLATAEENQPRARLPSPHPHACSWKGETHAVVRAALPYRASALVTSTDLGASARYVVH